MGTTFRWASWLPVPMLFLLSLASVAESTTVVWNITLSRPLRDGGREGRDGQALVSPGGGFQLGFFTPSGAGSNARYLGIWYANISDQTVVWVANRGRPLGDYTGSLRIDKSGDLQLGDRSGVVQWMSRLGAASQSAGSPVAELLDDGNLVLRYPSGAGEGTVLWQSFDHPSDTLLPGMKLGGGRLLTSQRSAGDLSPGDYSYKVDLRGYPQLFLWEGVTRKLRTGQWDHGASSSSSSSSSSSLFRFAGGSGGEAEFSFEPTSRSALSRLVLNQSGYLELLAWNGSARRWESHWWSPEDRCDLYGRCGEYGVCGVSGDCSCLEGFQHMLSADYGGDGYNRCLRTAALSCQKGEWFPLRKGVKLPDTSFSSMEEGLDLAQCREKCSRNCSCVAFAGAEVEGGSGCLNWFGSLVDLKEYKEGGHDLYIRLAAPNQGRTGGLSEKKKRIIMITMATVIPGILLLWSTGFCLWKRNVKRHGRNKKGRDVFLFDKVNTILFATNTAVYYSDDDEKTGPGKDAGLRSYDLPAILAATEHFAAANLLGQGGFGHVYRGVLQGQEIAVKKLSKSSTQGVDEFKNEVSLIARLQHKNVVRLLGCCIEGSERMLIYEYMHNRSLDAFIFDKTKGMFLSWQRRFDIIVGVARGLLYLHHDSRFRIIHRDIKASNILLDRELNPKISDFGMAKIFGGDQTAAYTKRIVGTYGYMSPEYAFDGIFSMKSDVFSYGVLLLEIISGKKNRGFCQSDLQRNLLSHVWKLWREGNILELLDDSLSSSCPISEVLKCVQVGLLCVQEQAKDRPSMASVVLMLCSANATLPQPRRPGFYRGGSINDSVGSATQFQASFSVNQVTVTAVEAR